MAYLVTSLVVLRNEIDLVWPNRSRKIDGWVRDPRDGISYGHNPDAKGAVHAIDVDKNGIWPPYIIDRVGLVKGVIWYVIWNRQIWSDDYGWRPQPYTLKNPHTDHMHIEVRHTATAENYAGHWGVSDAPTQTIGQAPPSGAQWGAADPIAAMAGVSGHIVGAGTVGRDGGRAIAALRNL